jgi:hypothetical protein
MAMNLRIKKPVFIASMHHMHQVNERKSVGTPVMDIIIYLPENRTYAKMELHGIIYPDDHGKKTAIMFKGMEINLSDKNLLRLCKRLLAAMKDLVAYVRRLARL